jgi:hypothetical protein
VRQGDCPQKISHGTPINQSISSAYYCDVLRKMRKNVRRFAPKFGHKRTGSSITSRQHTVLHFVFHQGIFNEKQNYCHLLLTLLFLFFQMKIKLKGRQFDTIEVIEAKLQEVLNTLTEHDFQSASTNSRSAENVDTVTFLIVIVILRTKIECICRLFLCISQFNYFLNSCGSFPHELQSTDVRCYATAC